MIRRVITGHDRSGTAVFVEDAPCPHALMTRGNATTNLWQHAGPPDNAADLTDPVAGPVSLEPPPHGTVLRVVEFGPSDTHAPPDMHRTASLDYAFIIEGEIHAVLDDSETLMRAGDVLVQRGTNHAWVNRSGRPCRVLFVLIDASSELAGQRASF